MSKKRKQQAKQGTFAICITAGLIVGAGLGPAFGSVAVTAVAGAALGAVAGYLFTKGR